MQTIWTHLIPSASITTTKCGVVAVQNKSVYVGNPLQHYSFDPFGQNRNMSSPRSLSSQMKLSNNERFLALASDIVDLMDLERAKVVRQFTEHTNTITGICNENSSPHIWATVGMDKTMRIFDSRQHPGQILCIRNDYRHRCITYAPNSQMLFCGGENIFIFDIRANSEFNSIKTSNQVLDICCHPFDCVVLGCTDDRMIKVWDIDTKECLTQSFPFESQPQKVLFEEDGNAVITCTSEKLFTCGWEPFNVISQIEWSKSKQSKFMVMNGESENPKNPSMMPLNATVNTFDIKINEGLVMHLGISEGSKSDSCLGLRSVQVEVSNCVLIFFFLFLLLHFNRKVS
uniref:Uncharacterized protein n=1 Tax=Panagrolaimus superbus TaxID=310955 RepID=A0A914Y225_9BILA